ncbi:very short patch repair endonuclease [Olsenella sp. AF16-14LB]|nr:very short patch repair endonuclease [Olsenella sp. TM06-36]RGS50712.1 very short patch repair endonuclease [Olsenella sp. AF21-51]RGU50524.1 very short patch repair endonuclease [Olsenella sp. AF16-14LB]RGU81981.1 very short patch repair endonuclease [Olsenella sp. AF15-43LB]RHB57459.1 very short patch repair endonuclease [Olsenella sp. AM39-30AC]RHD76008.1 very short patch repair endonuclease [Olsenella sp. AM30-3LB]RHJ94351.1 very short patch repair endonuclease [Olsenella sp. AM05-7]R
MLHVRSRATSTLRGRLLPRTPRSHRRCRCILTSEATRHVMQANKSKNTKPELLVRARLREAGYTGYRLHWKKAPGKPDICFPGRRVAIFVNGCFWHRCPHCALPLPKTNVEFWKAKFERNRERDSRDNALLVQDGWTVIVVWECMLKKERLEPTMQEVLRELDRASGDAPRVPRVVEIGSARPWMLRRERQKLRSRYALR